MPNSKMSGDRSSPPREGIIPDRTQHRLCQRRDHAPDHIDKLIMPIDNIKADEPGQDHHSENHKFVELQNDPNQIKNRHRYNVHAKLL